MIIVRYADDGVVGFQHEAEARRFWADLAKRFAKFGLELHPEKTRLLEFGRHATEDRKRNGRGKPDTFDFRGFTHVCGKTRKGRFAVLRRTSRKRMRRKLLRQEPSALVPHARIRAGGAGQPASLPRSLVFIREPKTVR